MARFSVHPSFTNDVVRRSKRVWFDASESPEAERSARPFELRVGPSLIADVPRGERVHQRGLDLHAQGDLLPRRAPHAAARREPDGRHAASSRARARRDRARDGDVQRRRRHGLERRGPTSGERKGRSRDGRLRDSLRASSVWRDDARPDAPNEKSWKKGCRWIEKARTLDPLCWIWIFSCEVDIFARFGPDRPRIAIGNADQTLAVNVPPPRPNRFARARCRHNAPRPDARRGARESAGARVAEVGEAPSLPGVESRTDSRGAREAHRRTAPDGGFRTGKGTDERFTAGSTETARGARLINASTEKLKRTRVSEVRPAIRLPEPARARSRRRGLPVPLRASNARLVSFFPNARDTLARRGTFLSRREAHGVGARFDRSRPARPRTTPALLEDRLRASPRPPPRSAKRVVPARPARPASPHFR